MMKPQWLTVLGCLCILASPGRAMVVPTQDTMVVARSDDGTSAANADATSVTATEAAATEEPVPPIKLTDMDVTSTVALRYAHTAVVTSVRNPAAKAQEATFRVLLPETAFISGFTMTLDGKSYKAYVKEKEEAKQIYNQAVSQGLGAAHIATKARDSNQFTVSVNVEPNSVAVFNLTYEELLVRRNGVYNHAINLHPGALVPKLTVTVNIKEAQKISTLRVPEIRTGNEIDATEDDAQNTKAIIERGNNDREAKVVFKPDLQEQERLIEIYREKTKENRPSHPSFSYGYDPYEDEDKKQVDGVLGQFVVQYDVERPKDGEILVNDGYFVHFFAPSDLPPLSKHVVFVLDTSGSMMGRKIEQLRQAMQTILSELNQGDYFSIVEFASTVKVYEMSEADKEPSPQNNYYDYFDYNKKTRLVPPAQATPENVAKAKVIVSRLNASGGTNIYSALNVAIDLIKKGIGWTAEEPTDQKTTEVVQEETATASAAAATSAAASAVTSAAASAVTSATTSEVAEGSEVSKLEPIIIFLTDGDPTVGETDPTRITNHLTEKNTGFNKATIFSLAFGEDADRKFLRKLSLRNDGFMRHIYEAADAALQLREFYRQVSSPLLADVKFIYPKKQVKEGSVTKHHFRRFYSGSETVVAGVLEPSAEELTPQVLAFCGVLDGPGRKRLEILPKAPEAAKKGDKYLPLERLWAHLTVKQLLDERDAADRDADKEPKEDSPEKKALALALKYEFVTPLTSLVVVKPNATDNVNAESVDKQVPTPPQSAAPLVVGRRRAQAHSRSQLMYLKPLRLDSTTNLLDNATPTHGSGPQGVAVMAQYLPGVPGLPGPPAYASAGFAGSQPLSFHMGQVYRPAAVSGFPSLPSQPLFDSVPALQSPDFAPEAFEEPSFDYVPDNTDATQSRFPVPIASTTIPNFIVPLTSTTLRPRPNSLAPYHLLEFDWIQPLVANDAVTLQVNSSTVTLQLAKDDVPKPANGVDPECAAATDGAPGVCVYLTRCDAARTLTAQAYSNTYCVVNDKYAGVCCPKTSVDVGTPTPQP